MLLSRTARVSSSTKKISPRKKQRGLVSPSAAYTGTPSSCVCLCTQWDVIRALSLCCHKSLSSVCRPGDIRLKPYRSDPQHHVTTRSHVGCVSVPPSGQWSPAAAWRRRWGCARACFGPGWLAPRSCDLSGIALPPAACGRGGTQPTPAGLNGRGAARR